MPREKEIDQKDIDKLENIKNEYLKSKDGQKAGKNDGFIKTIQ